MRKLLGTAAAVGLLVLSGAAFAQNPAPAPILTINPSTDLIPDVLGGIARPSQQYTTPAVIAASPGMVNLGIVAGGSYTYANGQMSFLLQPSGTVASLTLTTEPAPGDEKKECVLSTATVTSLTLTANTGQTMNGGATALVANTPVCWQYSKQTATWYRSP